MRVEFKLEPGQTETIVTVTAGARTDEVQALLRRLEAPVWGSLTGWQGEEAALIEPESLLRCYAANKEVYAQTLDGEWTLRERLYELEAKLDPTAFVRISHSEIVHLNKIERLDLSLTGTIRMTLTGGTVCYASRRYVPKLQTALGLSGGKSNA